MNKIYFMTGPQGAGKGTQAQVLASRTGYFYFEMGQVLRDLAKQDSELGKKVLTITTTGDLVDDETIMHVLRDKFTEIPAGSGIIFDGFPRTLGQGQSLFEFLKGKGYSDFNTVFLNIPFEISRERLAKRAEIQHRSDDNPEAIAHRLELYQKVTLPMLNWMQDMTKFYDIDGTPPIAEVTKHIEEALEHKPDNAATLQN